jgi:hypothetical protein
MVRAAYLAMDVTGWFVIVPLSLASLLTGLISSLGTPWGLFRHYWVLAKFLLTVLGTVALLVHTQLIVRAARVAGQRTLSGIDLGGLSAQLVIVAGAGLVVLLVATALSVYKPRGVTAYGWRKQQEQLRAVRRASRSSSAYGASAVEQTALGEPD